MLDDPAAFAAVVDQGIFVQVDQVCCLQLDSDFLAKFPQGSLQGGFGGVDMAARRCIQVALEGVAGAGADLQQGARLARRVEVGGPDKNQPVPIVIAVDLGAGFDTGFDPSLIEDGKQFVGGHEIFRAGPAESALAGQRRPG